MSKSFKKFVNKELRKFNKPKINGERFPEFLNKEL